MYLVQFAPHETTEVCGVSSINTIEIRAFNEQAAGNLSDNHAGLPSNNSMPSNPNYASLGGKIKLPKLNLPLLNGKITEFQTFWNIFENTVHKNTSLSIIEKFNYLYTQLEGPALLVIKGLALTEENYQNAIDILKQRFGNTQVIISAHMDEMLKLPDCSTGRVCDLRRVYDKINVHVRGLEALGVKPGQYGSLLIPVIMSKLTPELRVQIARKTSNQLWKINDILTIIQMELQALEVSESVHTNNLSFSNNYKQNEGWKQNRRRNSSSSAASLFVKDEKVSKRSNVCIVVKSTIQHHVIK